MPDPPPLTSAEIDALPPDQWCVCGYLHFRHGSNPHACTQFTPSIMFNRGEISEKWLAGQPKRRRR